ncbi:DUF998 domain-containing protein [Micromonospora sp. NBC_01813]|uniref:DUF998 domain-containing protein n=1 Tax=Micromonospora sp. NBC_01813 TaxID=2975988 RepID=UPI002DDA05F2|nr:DUF998 domain-containing protein [Micromonospora sp. NBC_01813]WSA11738.1 DUF998 domain-containing protein [Micromonospora sp. NBC_01813]
MWRTRWWAVGAAVGAVGGAVTATVAVIGGPGPRLRGYVSESGVGDGGFVLAYQLGFLALAASLLLLAGALRPVRAAAALLVAAAGSTAISATVPCRQGCPLPPHDPVTVTDLVHGGASIVAVACCVFAMVAIWWSVASTRSLRRLALWAVAAALPLSAAVGLVMLLIGGGLLVGVLERLLLLLIVAWCAGSAVTVIRDPAHSDCDYYVAT